MYVSWREAKPLNSQAGFSTDTVSK